MIEPAEGEFSGKGSSVKHSGDVAAECWSCCGRGNHPGREDESSSKGDPGVARSGVKMGWWSPCDAVALWILQAVI